MKTYIKQNTLYVHISLTMYRKHNMKIKTIIWSIDLGIYHMNYIHYI